MRARLAFLATLLAAPGAATALELTLPVNASMTREIVRDPDSYLVPVGPYADDTLPTIEVEGALRQQAWRMEKQAVTTLQMLRPLREQLGNAGFEIVFDCAGQECGGFDFRFGTRVMPAPDMFVDLFDFRFLTAIRKGAGTESGAEYVTVITSRAGATGYIQIIQVKPQGHAELSVESTGTATAVPAGLPDPDQPVVQALVEQGHVILSDLDFGSGSSALGDGPFASLASLAEYLRADTARRIALVGHTDTVGGLEPNIALSRRRAISVMEHLVRTYDIDPDQLEAGGMGYLSPIAPNQTAEGREANRRVEAVLLNTE